MATEPWVGAEEEVRAGGWPGWGPSLLGGAWAGPGPVVFQGCRHRLRRVLPSQSLGDREVPQAGPRCSILLPWSSVLSRLSWVPSLVFLLLAQGWHRSGVGEPAWGGRGDRLTAGPLLLSRPALRRAPGFRPSSLCLFAIRGPSGSSSVRKTNAVSSSALGFSAWKWGCVHVCTCARAPCPHAQLL